jgi:hypothetical protein
LESADGQIENTIFFKRTFDDSKVQIEQTCRTMKQSIIDILDKRKLNYEDDVNWTKWKESIENARVYHIQNDNEDWLKDDTNSCIQIKRMTMMDLPDEVLDGEIEHPY